MTTHIFDIGFEYTNFSQMIFVQINTSKLKIYQITVISNLEKLIFVDFSKNCLSLYIIIIKND